MGFDYENDSEMAKLAYKLFEWIVNNVDLTQDEQSLCLKIVYTGLEKY